jgi:hypothetical protein
VAVHLCPEVFRTGTVGASQTRLKSDATFDATASAAGGNPTLPAMPRRSGSGRNPMGEDEGRTDIPPGASRGGKKAG